MKPVFTKILESQHQHIFETRIINRPYFSTAFHFHQECQMTYIEKSAGKRLIGDSLATFESDELTFIGSNLPHVWHNDRTISATENQASSLALFLEPDLMLKSGAQFFNTNELSSFFELAKRGLLFYGETKLKLITMLKEIVHKEGVPKTVLLFQMLDILTKTKEYQVISGEGYLNTYINKDNKTIDKIFSYVFDNYQKEIKLEVVAEMANLTKTAFCRYFKSRTQKTFIQFVHEVRVSQACKLITDNQEQINNIAYSCGFNTLSNFNKIFKSIKGITPSSYKSNLTKDL